MMFKLPSTATTSRQRVAADQVRKERRSGCTTAAGSGPDRRLAAVADQVKAQLAVGRFDRGVHSSLRHFEAAVAHRQLEVRDQSLDR